MYFYRMAQIMPDNVVHNKLNINNNRNIQSVLRNWQTVKFAAISKLHLIENSEFFEG